MTPPSYSTLTQMWLLNLTVVENIPSVNNVQFHFPVMFGTFDVFTSNKKKQYIAKYQIWHWEVKS